MANELTEDQRQQIREQLESGHKLAAIKLYREWTGDSLAAAKHAVERWQGSDETSSTVSDKHIDDAQMDGILDAIERGKKLDAVKLYREASGASLKESKQFVEALTRELGVETRAGCASTILAALIIGAGIVSAF